MKRSLSFDDNLNDINESPPPVKKIDSIVSSETDDSSTVSSTESTVEDEIDYDQLLEIDNIEDVIDLGPTRQDVIRCTLALICRTNIYDWNIEEDYSWMSLRDLCVVHNDNDQLVECQLYLKLARTVETTFCEIAFLLDGAEEKQHLRLRWSTYHNDEPILTIGFTWQERFLFFFNRDQADQISIRVQDSPSYHWCYFPDARFHLYRISP